MLRKSYPHVVGTIILISLFVHVDCRHVQSHPREISTTELQTMMESDRDIVLINLLPRIIYDTMHLPGSVNIPIGVLAKMPTLPYSLDTPLVFYCMGYL